MAPSILDDASNGSNDNGNPNLVVVIDALVDRLGLKAVMLALAATCHSKAIARSRKELAMAANWEAVAADIERFARTSLRGLR